MEAESLLREITDYCRRAGVAESTFGRLAVNDGKFVNRLRDGGRITTTTFERVRAYIATRRLRPPLRTAVPDFARSDRASGAVPPPATAYARRATSASSTTARSTCCSSAPAPRRGWSRSGSRWSSRTFTRVRRGARLRRRRRRRHRAHARDARDAQPLPDDAVLHRRQGDQPRGRAAGAGEDARPVLRAPGDGAGDDQPLLPRGAVARPRLRYRGDQPRLARGRAHRHDRPRVRGADHRPPGPSSPSTGART